jgi:hypothetical protein
VWLYTLLSALAAAMAKFGVEMGQERGVNPFTGMVDEVAMFLLHSVDSCPSHQLFICSWMQQVLPPPVILDT